MVVDGIVVWCLWWFVCGWSWVDVCLLRCVLLWVLFVCSVVLWWERDLMELVLSLKVWRARFYRCAVAPENASKYWPFPFWSRCASRAWIWRMCCAYMGGRCNQNTRAFWRDGWRFYSMMLAVLWSIRARRAQTGVDA